MDFYFNVFAALFVCFAMLFHGDAKRMVADVITTQTIFKTAVVSVTIVDASMRIAVVTAVSFVPAFFLWRMMFFVRSKLNHDDESFIYIYKVDCLIVYF